MVILLGLLNRKIRKTASFVSTFHDLSLMVHTVHVVDVMKLKYVRDYNLSGVGVDIKHEKLQSFCTEKTKNNVVYEPFLLLQSTVHVIYNKMNPS